MKFLGGVVAMAGVALIATSCSTADSGTRGAATDTGAPAEWSADTTYAADGHQVTMNDRTFVTNWYASPGECPIESECPDTYVAGQWDEVSLGQSIPISDYSDKEVYKPFRVVTFGDGVYYNKWRAEPGQCPVFKDCPEKYEAKDEKPENFVWADVSNVGPHEFDAYDYETLQSTYLNSLEPCTKEDYNQTSVRNWIDSRIKDGDIKPATPEGGFSKADREALYREAMLPCQPDVSNYVPKNVEVIREVLPKAKWDKFAANILGVDGNKPYITKAGGEITANKWPHDPNFKDEAYVAFQQAAARFPYFCGEEGEAGQQSIEETCKREIAALLAHAAQETGGGLVAPKKTEEGTLEGGSFAYTRESFVNDPTFLAKNTDCPEYLCNLVDDKYAEARFHGRGYKQVTHYYNYAGLSAAAMNGNYTFLLDWPDMVAYDHNLYFLSGIWFSMANQPPKPSMHEVLVGNYEPSTECTDPEKCHGVVFDADSGVKQAFPLTIEIVNGQIECRYEDDPEKENYGNVRNASQSDNRLRSYKTALTDLDAKLTKNEKALDSESGCNTIADNASGEAVGGSLFSDPNLQAKPRTWIDFAEGECVAQNKGGKATISVAGVGIAAACQDRKPRGAGDGN